MARNIILKIENDIATITLKAPEAKVNILDASFLADLEETAKSLVIHKNLKGAIVKSDQPSGFIAGADINAIADVRDTEQGAELARQGQRTFSLWNMLPFPVVAAIHGHCIGGGTEFALSCHYRIASEDAVIALPEVKLGILPGFGGTQRLPRLISIASALDIILGGRALRGPTAYKAGLVDILTTSDKLKQEALNLLHEVMKNDTRIRNRRKAKRGGWRNILLEKNPIGRSILFKQAHAQILKKTGSHYPAPFKALETIQKGLDLPLKEGLEIEAIALGELIVTDVCKNLVHLFHLSQRPKKTVEAMSKPPVIAKAAVLGAGVMGGGIAHLLASNGIPVLMKDINQQALDTGMSHAAKLFQKEWKRKQLSDEEKQKLKGMIVPTLDYEGFESVDLVIEAVVEKIQIKQEVLRDTEPHLPENALFASNTSALSISELQTASTRPQQIGGMHFFNPVHKMPLVEIVRGEKSDQGTVDAFFSLAVQLGKTPIMTADRTGFLVNRLLVTYLLEAALTACEGVNWKSIDELIVDFGFPMGPFRLVDEVGIDIAAEVGDTLCQSFPYLESTDLLHRVLSSGYLGKKGGKGFYLYENGQHEGANLEIEDVIPKGQRTAGRTELKRLLYLMVNEAGRCLEEEIVSTPEDIDTGMVFGTGFPPFHGGLCRWANSEGLPEIVKTLKAFASQHGERFAPCDYLSSREKFYVG